MQLTLSDLYSSLSYKTGRVLIRVQRSVIKRIIHQTTLGQDIDTAVETELIYSPHRAQLTLLAQLPNGHYNNKPASGLCMLHVIHQTLKVAVKQGANFTNRLTQLLNQVHFQVQRTEVTRPFYLTLIDIIISEVYAQTSSFPYLMQSDIDEAIDGLTKLQRHLQEPGSGSRPIPSSLYLVNTFGRMALGVVGLEVHEWTQTPIEQMYHYLGSTKSIGLDHLFSAHHLRRTLGATHQYGYS
jgi:hypothetical protein